MIPADDGVLREVYRQIGITTDRLPKNPRKWNELTEIFNDATDRSETREDLLHYMETKRKDGKWEKLGRSAKNTPEQPAYKQLDPEEIEVLQRVYVEFGVPSDHYKRDSALKRKLQRRVALETGTAYVGSFLACCLVDLRKDRLLPPLGLTRTDDGQIGFNDFDQAEDM